MKGFKTIFVTFLLGGGAALYLGSQAPFISNLHREMPLSVKEGSPA